MIEAFAAGVLIGAGALGIPWLAYLRGREHGRVASGGDP